MNDKILRNRLNKIREAMSIITEEINNIYNDNSANDNQTFGGGILGPIRKEKTIDSDMVETKCQNCGAKVMVRKNQPYFGILCNKCMFPKIYSTGNQK